ncbi:endonuclease MutS2 [Oryza brachyantha]|uniref:DNA mismatch repair proteins mutS family domain-containing protein n=1 Tax=Oryza brachyantha TaxID=4533 RepID=J3N3Z3_ORYBR|nr:endonuclease MutS2 [Oryza brachyantha]XP_015697339.1 endonuclease MutS2 [Oryza brachyantha]XP_015697340.1 endonuclease MutS2 [Oryza brachyantha]XP_015697342.1 endonuclease MutS2 [Oryza brachyantha]
MVRLSTATLSPLASPSPPHSSSTSRLHLRARRCRHRLVVVRLRALPVPVTDASPSARSLRLLEWGKVCDAVASFAGTAHGREATKAQLWEVEDVSYEQSRRLLQETEAAVRLIDSAGGGMDFSGLDTVAVESAIHGISGGAVIKGQEAVAIVSLMLFIESLQVIIKAAMKQDEDSHERLMTLTGTILDAVINKSLVKSVQDVIDDDGSVKDTASPELRRYREQVQVLESRLYQLMDKLMRNSENEASVSEVCIVNGRCCIKVTGDKSSPFDGLLLSSGSDAGSMVEPIVAVPLNDELQEARALVAKAELDALSKLTDKILLDLDNIQSLLQATVELDKVAARAKYSIAYDGTYPDLYLPNLVNGTVSTATGGSISTTSSAHLSKQQWKLYMPNAYHPLLLQQHQENLHHAKKDVASATAEIRRRRIYGQDIVEEDQLASDLDLMKIKVSQLEKYHPVPVDFFIAEETTVLVITGPNTGGKTISLKTVGLASLMSKIGLYILASEPVKIPWFNAVYADIGDEQSLTQSLSTFSGHLKQNGAIRAESTSQSLVLLDEVGAGTNPLEGAALGMSLLESFAEAGSFLTLATTHHGELKTLKYSNDSFENACMEFDEDNLKPTFRILWGIPGRSNAINIAERLGLPSDIIESSRQLLGTAGAEINALILDMENFKQQYQHHLQEAQYYLKQSKELHNNLEEAQKNIIDHTSAQRKRKARVISEYAVMARSIIRKKFQQFRESAIAKRALEEEKAVENNKPEGLKGPEPTSTPVEKAQNANISMAATTGDEDGGVPEVGDLVYVPKLRNEATVVKIDSSKNEVQVQAGIMKLKLKLKDVKIQKRISR